MHSDVTPTCSVVFPVYDEAGNLELLYQRVHDELSRSGVSYEMIFVDNGSSDGSLEIIKELSHKDSNVHFVSLSRNFGHQGALFAGMNYTRGNAVITMDADLQHPPSLIPKMIQLWQDGSEVVFTTKKNHRLNPITGVQVKMFYWLMSKLSGLKLSFGQSDFRLIDRKVVTALLSINEYRKFLRGTVQWLGFRQTGIEYEVDERYSGISKFSYKALFSFAVDGILAFSSLPLRWFTAAGVLVAAAGLCYAIAAIIIGILSKLGGGMTVPPGWATLAATITFFGGVQLLGIGILGEYLSRVFEQTKGRPVFIVREFSNSLEKDFPDLGRVLWSK